jgi:hypothetical protein
LTSHFEGAQFFIVVCEQPPPAHWPAETNVFPVHMAALHMVPFGYFAQAPPWHFPFVPQVLMSWLGHCASAVPSPTGWQAPVSAQVLQAPQLTVPQQVPLTQFPLAQSPPAVQDMPTRFFVLQVPAGSLRALQNRPEAQSLSAWQLTLQPLVVQA